MKKLKYFTIIGFIMLFTGCQPSEKIQPSGHTIKVGFIGHQQGNDFAQGVDSLKGILAAKAALPLVNNGDELVIISKAEGNSIEATQQALFDLIHKEKVVAVLLAFDSKKTLQLKTFIESQQTPVISLIATHPDVITNSQYISQLCFNDLTQATVAALYIRDELLHKKAAIFIDKNDVYSKYLGETFRDKFKSVEGKLTAYHSINNIKKETLKQLQEDNTEILFLPISIQDVLRLTSILDEIDWSPALMSTDGILASTITQFPDKTSQLENMYTTDLFSQSKKQLKARKLGIEVGKNYHRLYQEKMTSYTALGIEGYALLKNAINHCSPGYKKQCINNQIRSTEKFPGIISKISISKTGKATRPVYINTIKKGKLETLVKVY